MIIPDNIRHVPDPVALLLSKLPSAKPMGTRWMAKCPAHPDDKPSLQIARGDDGRALVVCFAGCTLESILGAVGLAVSDLFVSDKAHREPETIYTYHTADAKIAYQVIRKPGKDFVQRRPNGGGKWVWNLEGVKRVPYRLPELLGSNPDQTVFIVEGEKDVDRLSLYKLVATTNSGGAGKWTDEHSAYLEGRHVVILPDNDDTGHKHGLAVAQSLEGLAASIHIVYLPDLPPSGDVSDWLDKGHKVVELRELIAQTKPWSSKEPEPEPEPTPEPAPQPVYELVRAWEEEEPVPRHFAIAGLVPDAAVTLFYGDGGQGKSYIALQMACLSCLGFSFLGRFVEQRAALYLDAELDKTEFVRRAYKLARGIGQRRPPEGLHYFQLPGSLSEPNVQTIVRQVTMASEARFVVLDSLSIGSFAADAADPSDMIKVMKFLESLGTAVLAIDHIPKPMPGTNLSQYRAFGSVFKGNVARSAIQIIRADGGALTLLHKKSNFSALSDPLHLALEFEEDMVRVRGIGAGDERLAGSEDNLPATDQVYQELSRYDDGARPEFLSTELGKSLKTIKNHLTILKKKDKAYPVGDGRWIASPDPSGHRDGTSGLP